VATKSRDHSGPTQQARPPVHGGIAEKPARMMWRWIPSPITFFTAVLAIFTIVLAISTSVQVWAFIESERAFVTIDIVGVEGGKILEAQPVVLNLSVRNFGRESAFMEEAVISYQLGALPREPRYVRGILNSLVQSLRVKLFLHSRHFVMEIR
jgi:hypothetical protein